MPDDPTIPFDELKKILDDAVNKYRSLSTLGMDAQNAGMVEYLSSQPAFEVCGTERGVAWANVKNGGLVIFDATGNDKALLSPQLSRHSPRRRMTRRILQRRSVQR
jgi:hypothetical protein